MSQTETHFGKLRKVEFKPYQTLEQWCEAKCRELGKTELSSYTDTWYEQLKDDYSETFFFTNNDIWEAFEHHEVDDDDYIYHLQPNEDGTLTFIMQFYNGGTCLTECIEESLQKLNK